MAPLPAPGQDAAAQGTGGGRLRRDAERNRQRLMTAARELFAARGLDVSLDDIARHAGVGVATAYRRFPDKEQLIDALFEERMVDIVQAARECAADEDPWRGLAGWLTRVGEAQEADRGMRMLFATTGRGSSRIAGAREQLTPLLGGLIERAQACGQMRADVALADLAIIVRMLGSVTDYAGDVQPGAWQRSLGILLDGLAVRREAPRELAVGPMDAGQLDAVMRGGR